MHQHLCVVIPSISLALCVVIPSISLALCVVIPSISLAFVVISVSWLTHLIHTLETKNVSLNYHSTVLVESWEGFGHLEPPYNIAGCYRRSI